MNGPDYVVRCARAKDYAPLVHRLRNGDQLSQAERDFLADHLEGKREGRGRGASPRRVWEARRHFRLFFWLTEFEGRQPDHAYDELACIHGVSRRAAIDAIKLAKRSGHAADVAEEERHLLRIAEEFENPAVRAIEQLNRTDRRREVLAGVYRDPRIYAAKGARK